MPRKSITAVKNLTQREETTIFSTHFLEPQKISSCTDSETFNDQNTNQTPSWTLGKDARASSNLEDEKLGILFCIRALMKMQSRIP